MASAERSAPVTSRNTVRQSRVAPAFKICRSASPTSWLPRIRATVWVLVKHVAAQMLVQLIHDQRGHGVVIVLPRVVVDMGLGTRQRTGDDSRTIARGIWQ